MKTEIFDVQGMSCEACAGHVTRALTEIAGVQSATVSLKDNAATVTYDPAIVKSEDLVEAVTEEGYTASPRNSA